MKEKSKNKTPKSAQYALAYAQRGWPVLPLHGIQYHGSGKERCACGKENCSSPGKHPIGQLVPQGLDDATSDLDTVARWFKMYPEANVGVRTGEEAGIVVLDVDPGHGGAGSLEALKEKHGDFTGTVEQQTGGGGRHLFFQHPGSEGNSSPVRNSAGFFGDGLDVRGDGGYIVAPPSKHASGGVYVWSEKDASMQPTPEWLKKASSDKGSSTRRRRAMQVSQMQEIGQGQRNVALTSFAGSMRRAGMDEQEMLAALYAVNERRCQPPLSTQEVEKVAASVARYDPAEDALKGFEENPETTKEEEQQGFTLLRDILIATLERADKIDRGEIVALSTGYEKLDAYLGGGLHDAELSIWAARPSMGKTSLATCIAINVAKAQAKMHAQPRPVGIFSAEMARGPLSERFLATEGRFDGLRIRSGSLREDDWDKMTSAAGRLGSLPIYVNDDTTITPMRMSRIIEDMEARTGEVPALVMVDYLQLVRAHGKKNTREQEVASVTSGLKTLAKHFHIPVMALAQLNRQVSGRSDKRPVLTDLRNSGQIEQDADVVAFLHRPEYYGEETAEHAGRHIDTEGLAQIIIEKQRNGPKGTALLRFIPEQTRFEDWDMMSSSASNWKKSEPYSEQSLSATPRPVHNSMPF